MRKITLEELKEMSVNASGEINAIYLHWSAGHYDQPSEHYHINIFKDGSLYTPVDSLAEVLSHTWRRNTGAIGISVLCAFDATGVDNLGSEPPTTAQIETMSMVVATLCKYLQLPIEYEYVKTHAEAADEDEYGPKTTVERWDGYVWIEGDEPGSGGDLIRGKANFYLDQV